MFVLVVFKVQVASESLWAESALRSFGRRHDLMLKQVTGIDGPLSTSPHAR